MLKSIPTARSECTAKNTSTRPATIQTTLFVILLTSFAMIKKRLKRKLETEIFRIVKNIVLTKNWFVESNFFELPELHMEKYCSGHLYFLLKTKLKLTTFRIFQLQST